MRGASSGPTLTRVSVGTVTTLAAGASATVTNSGTAQGAVLNFGIPQGTQGIQGVKGTDGANGTNGTNGAAGVNAYSTPVAKTVVVGTAYQATVTTKPAQIMVTLTSNAALTLGGGATFEADVVIGTVATIATTGGTPIAKYKNSLTGTLVVGLAINTTSTNTFSISLPAGWYYCVRAVSGTTAPTVLMTFDQAVG